MLKQCHIPIVPIERNFHNHLQAKFSYYQIESKNWKLPKRAIGTFAL